MYSLIPSFDGLNVDDAHLLEVFPRVVMKPEILRITHDDLMSIS